MLPIFIAAFECAKKYEKDETKQKEPKQKEPKQREPKQREPKQNRLLTRYQESSPEAVGTRRLELRTPCMSYKCSNQLSYAPMASGRSILHSDPFGNNQNFSSVQSE